MRTLELAVAMLLAGHLLSQLDVARREYALETPVCF